MASLYFNDDKAPRDVARSKLMEFIADNWTKAYTVDFWSDGGGAMIRAILEVDDVDKRLDAEIRSKFEAKWMGWRLVVLKVPVGHIRVFFNNK